MVSGPSQDGEVRSEVHDRIQLSGLNMWAPINSRSVWHHLFIYMIYVSNWLSFGKISAISKWYEMWNEYYIGNRNLPIKP